MRICKLNESFPHLRLLENKDLNNVPILTKELIKVIMGYDVPKLVIDAYQKYRSIHFGIHLL